MLEYEAFYWTSLHPWTYLALIKSGTKKGKIQEEKKINGEKKQHMSLYIGLKPLSQKTHVNLQGTAPVYLRQDGEEVESNISSLIMVSDMRLSRRGPAALPPIPCIIITEWRCRDAEMRRCGDAGQHRYFDVESPLVHCPLCPAATVTRTHNTYMWRYRGREK